MVSTPLDQTNMVRAELCSWGIPPQKILIAREKMDVDYMEPHANFQASGTVKSFRN